MTRIRPVDYCRVTYVVSTFPDHKINHFIVEIGRPLFD